MDSPDPSAGREQEDLQALAHQHNDQKVLGLGSKSVNAEPQSPALHVLKLIVSRARLGKSFFLCQGINQLSQLLTTLHTR